MLSLPPFLSCPGHNFEFICTILHPARINFRPKSVTADSVSLGIRAIPYKPHRLARRQQPIHPYSGSHLYHLKSRQPNAKRTRNTKQSESYSSLRDLATSFPPRGRNSPAQPQTSSAHQSRSIRRGYSQWLTTLDTPTLDIYTLIMPS